MHTKESECNCKVIESFKADLEILVDRYFNTKDEEFKGLIINGIVVGKDHNHGLSLCVLPNVNGVELAKAIFDMSVTQDKTLDEVYKQAQRTHNMPV